MTVPLLDANVLIALTVAEHEHHDLAARWLGDREFAVCPITEGALVRFLLRLGESGVTAGAVIRGVHSSPRCAFWPDSISYAAAGVENLVGHREATDAYLVALAQSMGGTLATLDRALAAKNPGAATLLIERG